MDMDMDTTRIDRFFRVRRSKRGKVRVEIFDEFVEIPHGYIQALLSRGYTKEYAEREAFLILLQGIAGNLYGFYEKAEELKADWKDRLSPAYAGFSGFSVMSRIRKAFLNAFECGDMIIAQIELYKKLLYGVSISDADRALEEKEEKENAEYDPEPFDFD